MFRLTTGYLEFDRLTPSHFVDDLGARPDREVDQ